MVNHRVPLVRYFDWLLIDYVMNLVKKIEILTKILRALWKRDYLKKFNKPWML